MYIFIYITLVDSTRVQDTFINPSYEVEVSSKIICTACEYIYKTFNMAKVCDYPMHAPATLYTPVNEKKINNFEELHNVLFSLLILLLWFAILLSVSRRSSSFFLSSLSPCALWSGCLFL